MSDRYLPSSAVTAEELDDGICLYHGDTDEVLVLNQTAADVWRLTDGELDVDQTCERLASAYRSSPDALAGDVRAVIDDLSTRGFLVAAPSESGTAS